MNSKQRRQLRRYLKKNLYDLIYKDGLEGGRTGCFEYDLYPSNAKMYIDFPKNPSDNVVYAKIPSFHIINDSAESGALTIKFTTSESILALREVSGLKEVSVFDTENKFAVSQAFFPQFILETDGDYMYWMFPDYSNNLTIRKKESSEDNTVSTTFSLENLLDDENIPKEVRRELAFNLDLFKKQDVA